MKISKPTISILRNFASINGNFAFKAGNVISTMSEGRNLYAEAKISEDIETEFGIYNLSEFLGVVGLYDDPEFIFTDKYVTIKSDKSKLRIMATATSILRVPKNAISFDSLGVESFVDFDIPADTYNKIIKTSAVLHCPDIWINSDGTNLSLVVKDSSNTSANTFTVDLGKCDKTFQAHMKIDTLKFIPESYTVSIAPNVIRFVGQSVSYYVMLETDSEF